MIFKDKKRAFSLTELLIVIVVLAVLFAALAPIITKRRSGSSITNEAVWNYVNDDEQQRDAYYDPGVPKWPSTAYIGLDANRVGTTSPVAKVVIKASKNLDSQDTPQRQIQFRYGSGDGVNAGSLFFDDRANLMLAGNNDSFVKNAEDNSYGNTVAGLGAFSRIGSGNYNTAFGANVMKGVSNNAAIGYGAIYTAVGQKVLYNSRFTNGRRNIFIGSNSGQSEPNRDTSSYLDQNVAIGSNSMGGPDFFGSRNVYLGYMVGNGIKSDEGRVDDNVIVSSQYYSRSNDEFLGLFSKSAQKNVILGYDTFVGGPQRITNLTAAGYGACNSIDVNKTGSRTCIGYTSGGSKGIVGKETPDTFSSDKYDHVFLGGIPQGGFNGRAVVEVHNQRTSKHHTFNSDRGPKPKTSPTVILNSNIVVRGGLNLAKNDGTLGYKRFAAIDRDALDLRRNNDTCFWKPFKYFFLWSVWMNGGADSKSRNTMDFWGSCTSDIQSYSFASKCPDLKVSDVRLKENITENDLGIDEIVALMPYNYTFKDDKDFVPQTGVIAQDLQKVFKSSVYEGKDGYLRIRWDEMFYAVINAIKSIDKKLEKIAVDITGMEKDVKQLKSSHKHLQSRIVSLNSRAAKLEKK